LVELGKTRILCNAKVDGRLPGWLDGKGTGWITAEYSLLLRSTHKRTSRETNGLRGRTQEIRRFIGRGLMAAANLELPGLR
jgi:ribonuclease PH